MSKVFFTSDTHFGHSNIIRYSARPFIQRNDLTGDGGYGSDWVSRDIGRQRANEMDAALIANWNAVVSDEDIVYHLGDFAFGRRTDIILGLLRRLKGRIKFLWGNHDDYLKQVSRIIEFYPDLVNRVDFLGDYREIKLNGQDITLCHYAMATWNKKSRGTWMLCGHSHYNLPATRKDAKCLGKILDVGVDGNNLKPYTFEDIQKIMQDKPLLNTIGELNDHHGQSL